MVFSTAMTVALFPGKGATGRVKSRLDIPAQVRHSSKPKFYPSEQPDTGDTMSTSSSNSMTKAQRIGLTVFITAIILTAAMFYMGNTGTPLPKWVLYLTTVL